VTTLASDTPARTRSHRLELDAWGVVLCGGQSRRMGHDKARLLLAGSPLIERAVQALEEVTSRVLLASGAQARYPELGLECVLDAEAGAGPLAGLAAALAQLERGGATYACVLACDMPRVEAGAFRVLLARAVEHDADVCLVATEAGPEPLFAVVHVRARAAVEAALARGERRMLAFHPGLCVVTVHEAELGPGCARNLNTPEEFRAEGGQLA
jgi:molybdopterin-guanine dinucleotide biosynthesis protein A